MTLKKLFLIVVTIFMLAPQLHAAETAIIATVNDSAITTQDLVNRMRLIIMSSGLKADEETTKKIAPQILQSLINEHLQIEEATRQEIKISDDDINKAITGIEDQNKMQHGQLKEIMAKTHIPYVTLQQQVRGQIAWGKIRSKKIQPRITVTDEEADDYVRTQNLNPVQVEYYVNEIVIPVETAKDDAKAKALGEKLASELQKGADFKKIAKQFSQAASAQSGGDVGWLAENQIPKELLSEIRKAGPNKIIGPVKSVEGYFILLVPEARDVDTTVDNQVITLRHFEIPFNNEKEAKEAAIKISAVTDPIKGCKDSKSYADSMGADLQDYGLLQVKELQPTIRKAVADLPVARFSPALNSGNSLITFLVCSRVDSSKIPDDVKRDKAREILFKHKMELESRLYLRDLRRAANIEIKL